MLHESNMCCFTCGMKEVLLRKNKLYEVIRDHLIRRMFTNLFSFFIASFFKRSKFWLLIREWVNKKDRHFVSDLSSRKKLSRRIVGRMGEEAFSMLAPRRTVF